MLLVPNDISFYAGNDIVDLDDRDSRFEKIHPRFFERVFTKKEQDIAQQNPRLLYWAQWAAKEAAYKWIVQEQGETIFSHKLFEVDETFSFVNYQNQKIEIQVFYNTNFVYAQSLSFSALQAFKEAEKSFFSLDFISHLDAWHKIKYGSNVQKILQAWQKNNLGKVNFGNELSLAVRVLTVFILSEVTSVPACEMYIKKIDNIPYAFALQQEFPLPFTLSFSHHGNFFSLLLAGRSTKRPTMPKGFFIPFDWQHLTANVKRLR